ncbi:hypothetical protein HYV44_03065 [Candidatus Microgenomates bacterium]|nr:hypothetical protein [Candidatus Microgenomates bacterium]
MSWQNIKIFFSPRYLFNPYPSYDMKLMPYLLIFFGILLLLSIVSFILVVKKKKMPESAIWLRLQSWSGWSAGIGLVLLFFRYEGIVYLSMRLLLFAWIVIVLIWGVSHIFFYHKKYPAIKADFIIKKGKEKYFTRRKK